MNTSLRRKVKKRPVVVHRPKKVVNTHEKSLHRSMLSHSYNVSSYKMKINALLSNNRALAQALESANIQLSNRAQANFELQRRLTLQSPKIFKTKLQKVCEHLQIIVGLLQEVMEECDSYKPNLNDQLIIRDEKSLRKGNDEINNENIDVSSVNETPRWGNQQMLKVIRPSEMPAIVEQPEMIMDNKCQTSLNPELSADMSKINVRSRFNGKPKSLPRRQSQRNLSSNSDYINNEKLQFSSSDENENVNPSFSTQVNKSPMVMRECTENFNSASEDNSSKTDSNKASESYSNIHSLIPISRNKSKYELPSNVPEISNNCKIEENVQKQKSSHFKENLSSDKISPNKKCTKVKGKSPDRRKTFIISHEKKSLKRETYTISELNSTIASLSKVEDPNSSENSSPIKISNNCDKITSSSVVFENIYNKGLSYVNSNTNLISANENEKLGNNKIEKSRSRLLSHNKGIYESDKNTIKEMRSAIEKSKNHKISTDKKKIDIERNININETKSSSKKNVKFESIKYCHNSDQLVVTNSVDENMLKEISPIVFQTKRRQKSIRRKSLTNKNNETQLAKIDNDIFDECHMKEKLFKNKELTTQIANKELIIQLDDVLTPIKTHSNKTEENYIFITDPLDGSFLKVDTSIKLEENSVNEQNEESQDNIEDINNINDNTENLHREGRKRRAVVGVSYKEPSGNKYDND